MSTLYHSGELAVQARVGVQQMSSRVGNSIRSTIPPVAQAFLGSQRMIVVSSADYRGCVWASLLTGEPGFLSTPDEQTVAIAASPIPGDPLAENAQAGSAVGLLAIELSTRRRMRINGRIEARNPVALVIHTEQVFGNCHKYIQARNWADVGREQPSLVSRTQKLTDKQQKWIAEADTFFIATSHPDFGADASHRGGMPGFVHVEDARNLLFPDYAGNMMFQTLGNIAIDPHAGLLFIDFASGNILQLTGQAQIDWDQERVTTFPGAERLVKFAIDEAIEIAEAIPWRGTLISYSPANPL